MRALSHLMKFETYDHGSQVVRAVVIWSCSLGFEGLLSIGIDLVLVDSVKVLAKNIYSSTVVTNQDLESGDLVKVERTVVAETINRINKNSEVKLAEVRTL